MGYRPGGIKEAYTDWIEHAWLMENDASVEICKKRRFPRAAWKSLRKKRFDFPTFPTSPTGVIFLETNEKPMNGTGNRLPDTKRRNLDRAMLVWEIPNPRK